MDIKKDNEQSKVKLAEVYKERLEKTHVGRRFTNCAGFVKYLLGYIDKETFVRPDDVSEKGLLTHLKQVSILPLNEYSDEKYEAHSSNAEVGAFLHNKQLADHKRWTYLHFFVPHPDPKHSLEIFQRNGFEKDIAEIADIRDVMKDEEFKGETILVFFKRKNT
ncbi:MAG TPA: hypothetical protein VLE44_02805 [Candidatus Saccharimonadales bacterium]|nr:hypothetical protein [Candidatus Saccharimonadales bacterium]